jgi:L,D-peptidoglycan transpeptidase YkuD (ErfK/YbiS/YcfS/YnhG family)
MPEIVTSLHVRAKASYATRGIVNLGGLRFSCALGRSGRRTLKREGDGASPVGSFSLVEVLYRSDRILRPRTALPITALRPGWGWCEKVGDRGYNRRVTLPYAAAHEYLCREDRLYDVIVVTSHNRRPRIQGLGSAIFLHLARPDFTPTAGCIAVTLPVMREILRRCGRRTRLVIHSPMDG